MVDGKKPNILSNLSNLDLKLTKPVLSPINTGINSVLQDRLSEIARMQENFKHPTQELIEVVKEQHELDSAQFSSILLTLDKIEKNTASLSGVVELLQANNEHQQQIRDILNDILIVLPSLRTKKEVDSTFKKITDKINSLNKLNANINAVKSLTVHLYDVYDKVSSAIDHL